MFAVRYTCAVKKYFIVLFLLLTGGGAWAQYNADLIQTNVVLSANRQHFDEYLKADVIGKTFAEPLDTNNEYKYESACLAASQFMIQSDVVKAGFDTLFAHFDSLQFSTKRALLEAIYGLYKNEYAAQMALLLPKEKEPKLFAMEAVYLFRNDSSKQLAKKLMQQAANTFTTVDSFPELKSLQFYLSNEVKQTQTATPPITSLFAYQKTIGKQIIYSFQRWNRDYPGLAIVQNEDGSFARDSLGNLVVFRQLARSASNLPYFITSGSTPQGIYSVQGTAISHNNLIGPTPNLQLLLPYEDDLKYWHGMPDSAASFIQNYLLLLPPNWRNYRPVQEALQAGAAGRTAIIAHGSTIDPEYFKGKPYYPLSPTLGCLCGKENWNIFTGKLVESDQFSFVSTYLARIDDEAGYLMVINLDNKQQPVTKTEVEKLVKEFESKQKN